MTTEGLVVRQRMWKSIIQDQFRLAYSGKVSYEATENMAVFERIQILRELVEEKKAESEQLKEAEQKSKAGRRGKR